MFTNTKKPIILLGFIIFRFNTFEMTLLSVFTQFDKKKAGQRRKKTRKWCIMPIILNNVHPYKFHLDYQGILDIAFFGLVNTLLGDTWS